MNIIELIKKLGLDGAFETLFGEIDSEINSINNNANQAKTKSNQALTKSNQAISTANITKQQLDLLNEKINQLEIKDEQMLEELERLRALIAQPNPTINVTGVSVSPSTLTLDEEETSQLTETVSPSNATDKSGVWSSNNESVATVSSTGLVTAVSEGSCTITFTTNDGSFTDTTSITVEEVVPEEVKAFPSAFGGGAYATGGRGGNVYHVTTLSDNIATTGSFKWALQQPRPATIVFDVSGNIESSTSIVIQGRDLTIAGQTAPVGGITFTFLNPSDNFVINGKTGYQEGIENIIIRYIRIRYKKDNNEIGIDIYGNTGVARNIIFDHISLSYAGWTGIGLRGNESRNITFQNSLIAECKTGSIFGDSDFDTFSSNISFNGNFFYNTSHRFPNPNGRGRIDVINNVIQNPTFRLDSNTFAPQLNHINNYVAAGNWTTLSFGRMNRDFDEGLNHIYTSGNIIDNGIFENPSADNKLIWSKWNAGSENAYLPANNFRSTQYPLLGSPYPILTASEAYNDVIVNQDKGASKSLNADGTFSDSRDANDIAYFAKTAEGEGEYEAYTTGESGNDRSFFFEQRYLDFLDSLGSTPINTRPAGFYVNNPHIPQAYLTAKGITGNSTIHNQVDSIGYTLLEEYLNEVD